jgi:rhodanese-related sulfurtransferase
MRDRDALREGWEAVVATRDAAPADCPCRAVTAPLIAAWEAWDGDVSDAGALDLQWENLRRAQAAQRAPGALARQAEDFAVDVRTEAEVARDPRPERGVDAAIPVDALAERLAEVPRGARVVAYCASGARAERAVAILRAAGYRACNGHTPTCDVPGGDPPMGAAPGWMQSLVDSPFLNPGVAADRILRAAGVSEEQQEARSGQFSGQRYNDWILRGKDPPDEAFDRVLGTPAEGVAAGAAHASKTPSTDFLVKDPPLGAAAPAAPAAGGLGDLLGEFLKPAGQLLGQGAAEAGGGAGRAVGQSAAEALAAGVPAVAEALRREVPATVQAVTAAAQPAVQPLAASAGEAAGKAGGKAAVESARRAADEQGMGTGAKAAIGLAVLVGVVAGGVALAKHRKGKKS